MYTQFTSANARHDSFFAVYLNNLKMWYGCRELNDFYPSSWFPVNFFRWIKADWKEISCRNQTVYIFPPFCSLVFLNFLSQESDSAFPACLTIHLQLCFLSVDLSLLILPLLLRSFFNCYYSRKLSRVPGSLLGTYRNKVLTFTCPPLPSSFPLFVPTSVHACLFHSTSWQRSVLPIM